MTGTTRNQRVAYRPALFEDVALNLQSLASKLSARYAQIHDCGYERQRGELVGGSSTPKHERAMPLIGAVADQLSEATRCIDSAHRSLIAALDAIARAEAAVDKAHQDEFDPTRRAMAERSITRQEMVDVLTSKAAHLRTDADEQAKALERQVKQLENQIKRDEQRKADAEARRAGHSMSKGQRKRSRQGANGWTTTSN